MGGLHGAQCFGELAAWRRRHRQCAWPAVTVLNLSAARSRAASVVLLPVRAVTYVVRGGGGGGGGRGGSPIADAAQLLLLALLHHAPAGRGGNAFRQALRGLQARP
jgi:hypothetical protein